MRRDIDGGIIGKRKQFRFLAINARVHPEQASTCHRPEVIPVSRYPLGCPKLRALGIRAEKLCQFGLKPAPSLLDMRTVIIEQFGVEVAIFERQMLHDIAAELPARIGEHIGWRRLGLVEQRKQGVAPFTHDGVIAQKSLKHPTTPSDWDRGYVRNIKPA